MNPNEEKKYLIRDNLGENKIIEHIDANIADECDCISFKPNHVSSRYRPENGPLFTDQQFLISA